MSKKPRKQTKVDLLTGSAQELLLGDDPRHWLLVTNHRNMAYMLAAGMVTGPRGFGNKYYADPLLTFPGWIPLFRRDLPTAALDLAISESSSLRTCVATLKIDQMTGPAKIISRNGNLRDCELPAQCQEDDVGLLVRAPLPISMVIGIAFASNEDKIEFEALGRSVSNVSLTDIDVNVHAAGFAANADPVWPPKLIDADCEDAYPAAGQAVGGILALLYHISNRSELAVALWRAMCGDATDQDEQLIARDPILKEATRWLKTGMVSPGAEPSARLYWGTVDSLLQAKRDGSTLSPIDQALAYLEGQSRIIDEVHRARLQKTVKDMRSVVGFSGDTISELLERPQGALSRALLLFCLRERSEDLLDFFNPHLQDAEYLLACVLFAAKDGWLAMPQSLRSPTELTLMTQQRMSSIEHERRGTAISLGAPAPRPIPLRELFQFGTKGWNKSQKDAALELARGSRWTNCIRTRVNLGKGEYRLVVDAGGVQIHLDGEAKAVHTEVDHDKFLRALSVEAIAPKVEISVRKILSHKIELSHANDPIHSP